MSEIKTIEHTTLKLPYEILNRKFRAVQKAIDREVGNVRGAIRNAEKSISVPFNAAISDVSKSVAIVAERVDTLKRKADEGFTDELNAARVCKRRVEHLKEIVPSEEIAYEWRKGCIEKWKETRLDRMVVGHLLRLGHYKTAKLLAEKSDICDLTNIDIFQTFREVEEDLAKRSTTKCMLWCVDNKSKLKKINSTLEFDLRAQQFIELVRSNKRVDAIKHAQKYFPAFEETQLSEICNLMALLAYRVDVEIQPYKDLFDVQRWEHLLFNFRSDNFCLYQLSSESTLSITLQAGLSALKTPQCYSPACKNINCPLCCEDFNRIAQKLPYSHCVQSRLICRVTGQPLNEHNAPMMLPNGQIYGELALRDITSENGTVVCPVTKTSFQKPKIEKVFIM